MGGGYLIHWGGRCEKIHYQHEKKVKIQFLVTKRSQKSNSTYFSNFKYYLYSNSGLLFLIRISFEGSNFKKHFSLTFYAKTPKKWQNTVLGYKKESKFKI